MPKLKQLYGSLRWQDTDIQVPEYGTVYKDGQVETYIAVPELPTALQLRLKSRGYIAPGLAMFVYIDGEFQCSRKRCDLKMPDETTEKEDMEIDFEVYGKETTLADGSVEELPWRIEGALLNPDEEQFLGRIQVVVLRSFNSVRIRSLQGSGKDKSTLWQIKNHPAGDLSAPNEIKSSRWPRGSSYGADDQQPLPSPQFPYGLDGAWNEKEPHETPGSSQQWGYRMTGPDTGEYRPLSQANSVSRQADSTPSLSNSQSSIASALGRPGAPPVEGKADNTVDRTRYRSRSRGRRREKGRAKGQVSSRRGSETSGGRKSQYGNTSSHGNRLTLGDRTEDNKDFSKGPFSWNGGSQLGPQLDKDDLKRSGEAESKQSSSTDKQGWVGNDYTREASIRGVRNSKPALAWCDFEKFNEDDLEKEDKLWDMRDKCPNLEDAYDSARPTSPVEATPYGRDDFPHQVFVRKDSRSRSGRRLPVPGGWPRGDTPSPPVKVDSGWAWEPSKYVRNLSTQSVKPSLSGSTAEIHHYKADSGADVMSLPGLKSSASSTTKSLHKSEPDDRYTFRSVLQVVGAKTLGVNWIPLLSTPHQKEDRLTANLKKESRWSANSRSSLNPGLNGNQFYTIPHTAALPRQMSHELTLRPPKEHSEAGGILKYLDTHDEPYAVFTFYYQTKAALEHRLGIEIADPLNPDELERRRLMSLSKEELVEHILKAKNALKAKESTTTSWMQGSSESRSTQNVDHIWTKSRSNESGGTSSGSVKCGSGANGYGNMQSTDKKNDGGKWQPMTAGLACSPQEDDELGLGMRWGGKYEHCRRTAYKMKGSGVQKPAVSSWAGSDEGNSMSESWKTVGVSQEPEMSSKISTSQIDGGVFCGARCGGGDVNSSRMGGEKGGGGYWKPQTFTRGGSSAKDLDQAEGDSLLGAGKNKDGGLVRSKRSTSDVASQKVDREIRGATSGGH